MRRSTRYPPSFAYSSAPSVSRDAIDSRLSARSRMSQLPVTVQRNIPLPPNRRLSPLVVDEALPPVPFTGLDNILQWGGLRYLPCPSSHGRHSATPDELSNPATFPESEVFRLRVDIGGMYSNEITLYPSSDETAVSVSDVVAAVERELESAANRLPPGVPYFGRSASRGADGLWTWCGLAIRNIDEQGVWILYL